jgi:hypothetical protein
VTAAQTAARYPAAAAAAGAGDSARPPVHALDKADDTAAAAAAALQCEQLLGLLMLKGLLLLRPVSVIHCCQPPAALSNVRWA